MFFMMCHYYRQLLDSMTVIKEMKMPGCDASVASQCGKDYYLQQSETVLAPLTEHFEKLDEAFLRFFNRRRLRRAKPAIGERFRAVVLIGEIGLEADVRDVSMRGVGLAVNDEASARLAVDETVLIDLFVPGTESVVRVEGVVRHLTSTGKSVRAGFSVEPAPGGLSERYAKRASAALPDYIQRRLDEMERHDFASR